VSFLQVATKEVWVLVETLPMEFYTESELDAVKSGEDFRGYCAEGYYVAKRVPNVKDVEYD